MKVYHQTIRALLKKKEYRVGHRVSNIGRVRGLTTLIGGALEVSQCGDSVRIDISARSCYRRPDKEKLANVLSIAGYKVEVNDTWLIVSKKITEDNRR